jgi:hypothetical protein
MGIRWTTAFLDLPPAVHAAGTRFWSTATGSTPSAPRGDRAQFATLLPADGEAFLRVQRLDEGPRVHLDLHVDDLAAEVGRAVALGASLVSQAGHAVLRSPGGLTFCLVMARTPDPVRPAPVTGPRGGVSLVDQIAIDVPAPLIDAERTFWTTLTGWAAGGGTVLDPLARPDGIPLRLLLHRLGDDEHADAGARVLRRHERWTVLTDPAGLVYCVTDRSPVTGLLPSVADGDELTV